MYMNNDDNIDNDNGFDNVRSYYYWSSTTHASDELYAWVVDFPGGYYEGNRKTASVNVRCVRNGQFADADVAEYHRAIWDSDPSKNAVIGFSPKTSSTRFFVRYGFSTDESTWQGKEASLSVFDDPLAPLNSYFVRLKGLLADSAVYYKVCSSTDGTTVSCGQRFWFKTAPGVGNTEPFIVIAGGNSRTNRDIRRKGNALVAKIRPLFIMHGGDYTDSNNAWEMKEFLEDWELTFSDDTDIGYKRIYPLVPTLGNHESKIPYRINGDLSTDNDNFKTLCQVFGVDYDPLDGDCSARDTYGAFNVSDLLRVYTLNSEFSRPGWSSAPGSAAYNMNVDLSDDLNSNTATWQFAQYHQPMFPHNTGKDENPVLFNWWAHNFYDYGMNLVFESDAHLAKLTKPLKPIIDFSDDFSLDTVTPENYTLGGEGSCTWDGVGKRVEVLNGYSTIVEFSKSGLLQADKHTFSIDFNPTEHNNNSDGSFSLRLLAVNDTDDEKYQYHIFNYLDGSVKIGGIRKYVYDENKPLDKRNKPVEEKLFKLENQLELNKNYTIAIAFRPDKIVVHAFGETLVLKADSTSLKIDSFKVKIKYLDAYFDNIYYSKGFEENIDGGTVYAGEGSWGAPLRPADDNKDWTIASKRIAQFKVITVSQNSVLVRTAQFDENADTLTRQERIGDSTKLPGNVQWWDASDRIGSDSIGKVLTLVKSNEGRSVIYLVAIDDTATTAVNTFVDIDVLANDRDHDGTSVKIKKNADNGTTLVNASGVVTYTPRQYFYGVDTFTYTVEDTEGVTSNVATVTVTVLDGGSGGGGGDFGVVFYDHFHTDNTPEYDVDVQGGIGNLAWDSEGKRLEVLTEDDVRLTFSKDLSPTDTARELRTALPPKEEGTFFIDFLPVQIHPSGGVMKLRLMQDAQTYYEIVNTDGYGAGRLSKFVNGVKVDNALFQNQYAQGIDYTIVVNFSPSETTVQAFGETLTINSNSDAITVRAFSVEAIQQDAYFDNIVYIVAGNKPPVAADDNAVTAVDTPVAIDVLANDSDPDGTLDVTSVKIKTDAVHGTTSVNSDGVVTYTSAAGFSGSDSFTYTVDDTQGETSNVATVTVTVGEDFYDYFTTDSTPDYNVAVSGGEGSFSWDSERERACVDIDDNIKLMFAHDLSASEEGSFSIDVLPYEKYPSGGRVIVRLIEDEQNYYKIENTDGYGPKIISKYVNGVLVDTAAFNSEYGQKDQNSEDYYHISVNFSPSGTTVQAFGETLSMP